MESKGEMAAPAAPAAPETTLVAAGTCCLSGVRAPEETPRLVRMRGTDGKEYLVSEPCLDKYSRKSCRS